MPRRAPKSSRGEPRRTSLPPRLPRSAGRPARPAGREPLDGAALAAAQADLDAEATEVEGLAAVQVLRTEDGDLVVLGFEARPDLGKAIRFCQLAGAADPALIAAQLGASAPRAFRSEAEVGERLVKVATARRVRSSRPDRTPRARRENRHHRPNT